MKQMLKNTRKITLLFAVIFLLFACSTHEWPKLFGPNSNMVIQVDNLPDKWNDSLNVRWHAELEGEGWSSPIVLDDKVYITSSVLIKEEQKPQPPVESDVSNNETGASSKSYATAVYRWQLVCLNVKTGNEIWKQVSFEGNPTIEKHAGSTYACETPVTDGKYIYAYYGMVGVFCYDLDGNLIWNKDLGAYSTLNGWGTGSSPVLYKGCLYVQVDNEENSFLVALDALTGEEIWKVNRDEKTNYSTPVIWKNTIGDELVVMGKTVRSYNLKTGEIVWELNAGGRYGIPTPVFNAEHIYLGTATGRGKSTTLFAIKAGAKGDISLQEDKSSNEWVVWSNANTGITNFSSVLYNGIIYIVSSRGGVLTCVDAATGEVNYQEKIKKVAACWAAPWIYDNKLHFYDERGVTRIVNTGKEFELIGENRLSDKFWASVAPTSDAYIFKGMESIYCVGR